MAIWDALVRRSSLYRAAEAELIHSAEARDQAQDERDRLKARVEELTLDRDAARGQAIDAAQKVTDWLALRTFGSPIFDATRTFPPTPQDVTDSIARATPVHGRDHAREMTRRFLEECRQNAQAG
jgi:hypothetical protein